MRVRKTPAALAAVLLLGIAVAIAGPALLPQSYYFDTQTVIESLEVPSDDAATESFANTAAFYRLLGFGTLWPHQLAGVASFVLVFLAMTWSSGLGRARWTPWLIALVAAWTVPLAVFDGTYSKEVVALLVVAIMGALSGSLRGVVAATLVGLVYAWFFRTYWGVVIALWLTLLLSGRLGWPWILRLAVAVVAIACMSAVAHDMLDTYLSDGRTVAVEGREGDPYSVTVLNNAMPNASVATDVANTLAGWVALIVPVYLLPLGGLQHIGFAAFQALNTALFGVILWRLRDARDWRFLAASSFCVAYSLVQGMFEPDFGSFVKHETNLLPLYCYLLRRLADAPRGAAAAASVDASAVAR
jgi:hypothetical protein